MATFIFVLLIISFFVAAGIAFTKPRTKDELVIAAVSVGYALGGIAMAAVYELYKITGPPQ